jgi:hypothetical protein
MSGGQASDPGLQTRVVFTIFMCRARWRLSAGFAQSPPSLPPSLPELNCNTVPSWLGDVNLAPLRVLPRREREYVTPVVGEELGGHEQQQQEHEQARPLLPDCGDRS